MLVAPMPRRPARPTALLLALALSGCGVEVAGTSLLGIVAAAEVGTIAVLDRGMGDVAVSLVSGRDCSIVRLARQETYCAPREAPPAPPPLCTRSLGGVDCWAIPPAAWPPYRGIADGPATLNAAQERNRTQRWPGVF